MIKELLNGWFSNGRNSFAKKVDENIFDVITVDDTGETFYYVDLYNKVDISNPTEEELNRHSGNLEQYSKLTTDTEKAVYVAFHSMNCDQPIPCETEEELVKVLVELGVVDSDYKFKPY